MNDKYYVPFAERKIDFQYRNGLKEIVDNGDIVYTQMEEYEKHIFGIMYKFDLRNGFPVITERDIATPNIKNGVNRSIFSQCLGELCGFLNGARTQAELESFGCFWWKKWVTKEKCNKRELEEGDLGPGSYGPAWTNFPMSNGEFFNQIDVVLQQIRENPKLKTHRVSNWIPYYTPRISGMIQKVVVVPCHGDFDIHINTDTGFLDLVHIQRSADYPVGLPANIIQYAALTFMLAQVTGYMPGKLIYFIDDAHYYTPTQDEAVKGLLDVKPERFPTVIINPDIKHIQDFRPNDFEVKDYFPQSGRFVIKTPI